MAVQEGYLRMVMDILLTLENCDVMDPKLRKIVSFFFTYPSF